MDDLTQVGLAERSGSTPERIDQLVELGILTPQADGSFRPADIQRVRLTDALEGSGIRVEDLGQAIRSGRLSFAFLDLLFTEPKGYSTKTYKDVCAEYGWTMDFVERIHVALGLPVPSAEDRVREDDMQMFPIGQFALATGVPEAGAVRSLRVYAENLGQDHPGRIPVLPHLPRGADAFCRDERGTDPRDRLAGQPPAACQRGRDDLVAVPPAPGVLDHRAPGEPRGRGAGPGGSQPSPGSPSSGDRVPRSRGLHAAHRGARGRRRGRARGEPGGAGPAGVAAERGAAGQVARRRGDVPLPRSGSGRPVLTRPGGGGPGGRDAPRRI